MAALGNILWFVLVGVWLGTAYMLLGLVFLITIIGAPIGFALFEYAKLMYFPFGKSIVRDTLVDEKRSYHGVRKVFYIIINIIWLPVGISLAIVNIAVMFVCFITIILIPVGVFLAKSTQFIIWPMGARVVRTDVVQAIETANELERRGSVSRNTVPAPAPAEEPIVMPVPEPAPNSSDSGENNSNDSNDSRWN